MIHQELKTERTPDTANNVTCRGAPRKLPPGVDRIRRGFLAEKTTSEKLEKMPAVRGAAV